MLHNTENKQYVTAQYYVFQLKTQDLKILQISFRNTFRVLNGLDPDQDRYSVSPDLGQNCLPGLSADNVWIPMQTEKTQVKLGSTMFPKIKRIFRYRNILKFKKFQSINPKNTKWKKSRLIVSIYKGKFTILKRVKSAFFLTTLSSADNLSKQYGPRTLVAI